jgi:hypothetical protein
MKCAECFENPQDCSGCDGETERVICPSCGGEGDFPDGIEVYGRFQCVSCSGSGFISIATVKDSAHV